MDIYGLLRNRNALQIRRRMANEYIINSKLEEIIERFQDAKRKRDNSAEDLAEYRMLQNQLADFFYELSKNIMKAFNFKLIDPDDALQEGVLIALQKVDRFDNTYVGKNGKKAKAFNYMTTCILNHFRQLYRGAKNQHELQRRYYEHLVDRLDDIIRQLDKKGQTKVRYTDGSRNGPSSLI